MSDVKVLLFLDKDDDRVKVSIRPRVDVVQIDPELAKAEGIELDQHGFPTLSSLEAWHRKNNPHLFEDGE